MTVTKVEQYMNILNINAEEARQMIADDHAIDRNKRLDWEQSEEEEREARALTRPKVTSKAKGTKTKPKRDEDPVKRRIMKVVHNAIIGSLDDTATLENPEKTINFMQGGEEYTITLTKHRAKKAA